MRRSLGILTLDDAVADAETLLAKDYTKSGNWSLGQICGHLANWLSYGMDGFPKTAPPIRLMLWMARHTIGPGKLKQVIAGGTMPTGGPTIPASLPPADVEDRAGVEALIAVVERAKMFAGTPVPSPFFGAMDRDAWVKLNGVHAAHHLSFLVPKT